MLKAMITTLSVLGSVPSEAATIADLKAAIITIAVANTERTDNVAAVRAQLDPLVEELGSFQSLTKQEKDQLKVGGWKQLWTDDAADTRSNNVFSRALREQTYQVVFDNGVFYNISTVAFPFGIRETALLRATTTASDGIGNQFSFTGLELTKGPVTDATDLVTLADGVEQIGRAHV